MTELLKLPSFESILPRGLGFGANYLAEFEPRYEWLRDDPEFAALMMEAMKFPLGV